MSDRTSQKEQRRNLVRKAGCPKCGALAGTSCVGSRGQERVSCHEARWLAAGELFPQLAKKSRTATTVANVPEGAIFVPEGVAKGYLVYGIFARDTQKFGYVGQTGNFSKRAQGHIRAFERRSKRQSVRWMNSVIEKGGRLSFTVLELCQSEEASLAAESAWVAKLASEGHTLHNRWNEHQRLIQEGLRAYISVHETSADVKK